jgi:hypothetical protein
VFKFFFKEDSRISDYQSVKKLAHEKYSFFDEPDLDNDDSCKPAGDKLEQMKLLIQRFGENNLQQMDYVMKNKTLYDYYDWVFNKKYDNFIERKYMDAQSKLREKLK